MSTRRGPQLHQPTEDQRGRQETCTNPVRAQDCDAVLHPATPRSRTRPTPDGQLSARVHVGPRRAQAQTESPMMLFERGPAASAMTTCPRLMSYGAVAWPDLDVRNTRGRRRGPIVSATCALRPTSTITAKDAARNAVPASSGAEDGPGDDLVHRLGPAVLKARRKSTNWRRLRLSCTVPRPINAAIFDSTSSPAPAPRSRRRPSRQTHPGGEHHARPRPVRLTPQRGPHSYATPPDLTAQLLVAGS